MPCGVEVFFLVHGIIRLDFAANDTVIVYLIGIVYVYINVTLGPVEKKNC